MIRGMRLVIGGAALAAGILLQAEPAFAQVPPWAQQQRRYVLPQHQRPQLSGGRGREDLAAGMTIA